MNTGSLILLSKSTLGDGELIHEFPVPVVDRNLKVEKIGRARSVNIMRYDETNLYVLEAGKILQGNDIIVFRIPNVVTLEYEMSALKSHLILKNRESVKGWIGGWYGDSAIMDWMYHNGLMYDFDDVDKYCAHYYGYEPVFHRGDSIDGAWPECRNNDATALTNLVIAIYNDLTDHFGVAPKRSVWKTSTELINPSKEVSKIKTMLQKLSTTLRRVLNPSMQAIYRAGLIDGDLKLTGRGVEVLNNILLEANEDKLAEEAKEIIKEEEKGSKQ